MMSLTTRNIFELPHLFCAHVKLQTAHKMHLDSQHFEHLQFEACVVFGTMNVFFGNIHFDFLFMLSSVYWNTICLPLNPVSEEAPFHSHSYHTLTIIAHGFWVVITEFPKCFSKEELF
jgi:hypothetical protein